MEHWITEHLASKITFAGIATALAALNIGTVAGAVGVCTSAYTGLNAACDGLKDFAMVLDS